MIFYDTYITPAMKIRCITVLRREIGLHCNPRNNLMADCCNNIGTNPGGVA